MEYNCSTCKANIQTKFPGEGSEKGPCGGGAYGFALLRSSMES